MVEVVIIQEVTVDVVVVHSPLRSISVLSSLLVITAMTSDVGMGVCNSDIVDVDDVHVGLGAGLVGVGETAGTKRGNSSATVGVPLESGCVFGAGVVSSEVTALGSPVQ